MSRGGDSYDGPEPQAQKVSRYRALRGNNSHPARPSPASYDISYTNQEAPPAQAKEDVPDSAPAPVTAPGNSISRSMSRYRRRAASVSGDSDATPKIAAPQPYDAPPVPAIPSTVRTSGNGQGTLLAQNGNEGAASTGSRGTSISSSSQHNHHQLRHLDHAARNSYRRMTDHESQSRNTSGESERKRTADRDDVERRLTDQAAASKHAEQVAHKESEAHRLLAQQKKKDLERLQIQLANSQTQATKPAKVRSPVIEKFVMLTKRRKSKDGLSPTSSTPNRSPTKPPDVPKLPIGIEVGGKGIVPQTDAPVSAVNHGERIVSVRCKHHTFILSVSPDTTPDDIVQETAKNMAHDLEWSSSGCIVLESYGPLGLERRIRRFEHIRDVLNSWDRDTHNQLVVSMSTDPDQDRDLDVESVPDGEEPPKGVQLYMYHSNRPGKWNKRWVTLMDNGQIICAKKPNASSSDKDTLSLCHLSDYDIYTPVESQMRRHLKPPKKHCFAVKSQNKPAMFMNAENFVQYFCTEDPQIAAQFSARIQSWRSWYLVDRRPAARRVSVPKTDDKPPRLSSTSKHAPKKSINIATSGEHRLRISVDESPYAIGEFEPLLDMKRFDKRLSQFGKDFLPPEPDVSTMPKSIPAHLKNAPAESKSEGALIDKIKSADDGAFTGNGLLGQTYKERKASVDKEASNRGLSKEFGDLGGSPFTDGPSLLNKQAEAEVAQKPEISWFPSAQEHTAKTREVEKPRPSTAGGALHGGRPPNASRSQFRPPPLPQLGRRPEAPPHIRSPHRPGSPGGVAGLANPGARRQPPKPLVNLSAPTINEPPQWARKGHGVKAPEGMHHLVDMISVGTPMGGPNGLLEVPPRSAVRRGTAPLLSGIPSPRGASGPARTRSKSSGGPASRTLLDDIPPVPSLPGRNEGRTMTLGERDRAQLEAFRSEGRTMTLGRRDRPPMDASAPRDPRDRRGWGTGREKETLDYNSIPERTGTLKVV
ncbi:hypothetical protein JX265_013344 [Neoarthrinium moseri]|uniref:PH domain-containing protein n=1 Tax=Neoarthrinium moseri TaxID=1658444 RepID=A0A9P9W8Q9_9PEZI|nr:hypothetical protein JX265_013344 [Neoarthrinium moseri]